MLRAAPPGHPLQKPTVVQWDIGAMLSADGAADESVSPQSGISCRDQPMQAWAGSHRGNAVHLHVERTVPGRDADEAARRRVRWKVPRIDRIDRLEMRRIGAIDVAPDDSIER